MRKLVHLSKAVYIHTLDYLYRENQLIHVCEDGCMTEATEEGYKQKINLGGRK